MQEGRFKAALDALSDPAQTTVILVTRPDRGAIAEAARTSRRVACTGLEQPATGDQRRVSCQRARRCSGLCHRGLGPARHWPRCPSHCASCRRTACRCGLSIRSACPHCVRCWPAGPDPIAPRAAAVERTRAPTGLGRVGRRTGQRRSWADHGDGQRRGRQDNRCRRLGSGTDPARQDRAPEHHRSGSAPCGNAGWRGAGLACQPHRPEGRDAALCRQDHGGQITQVSTPRNKRCCWKTCARPVPKRSLSSMPSRESSAKGAAPSSCSTPHPPDIHCC